MTALAGADRSRRASRVIGLGIGTLAAYGRPGDAFTFFEIDPQVVALSTATTRSSPTCSDSAAHGRDRRSATAGWPSSDRPPLGVDLLADGRLQQRRRAGSPADARGAGPLRTPPARPSQRHRRPRLEPVPRPGRRRRRRRRRQSASRRCCVEGAMRCPASCTATDWMLLLARPRRRCGRSVRSLRQARTAAVDRRVERRPGEHFTGRRPAAGCRLPVMLTVPETLEGWCLLHQMFRVSWPALVQATNDERAELADGLRAFLEQGSATEGTSIAVAMLGHKADLMLVHARTVLRCARAGPARRRAAADRRSLRGDAPRTCRWSNSACTR